MPFINNNKDFNKYFNYNKDIINLNNYNNLSPTSTTKLEETIIKYNSKIGVLFCSNCSINLSKFNYKKHLSNRHTLAYNNYNKTSIFNNLVKKVDTLELKSFEAIREELSFNKYFFKDLPIILNNYKC